MILKPGADSNCKVLLDETSELLDREYTGLKPSLNRVGTRYQLACAYLLLQAARSETIQEALVKYDAALYEDIQPVILYEMRVRMCGKRAGSGPIADMLDVFIETGKVPARLLESYATTVKSNVEVKLLMALFGYKTVAFPGSEDGTGALTVAKASGKRWTKGCPAARDRSADEAFLMDNFDTCGILVLKDAHWSAVKSLTIEDGHEWSLHFLDPGIPRGQEFRLDPWNPRARLYFFKKDPGLQSKMARLVRGLLERPEPAEKGVTKPALEEKEKEKGG
nr:hypothetical protein [Candidatus Sigynarchaeum springense]